MGLRTLNTHLAWADVLALLGHPPAGRALPTGTSCPLCDEDRLHVYEDTTSAGAWHYCAACGSTGDMLDLAAAVWKMDTLGAIRRLKEHGLIAEGIDDPEKADRHFMRYGELRKRILAVWAWSQQRLLDNSKEMRQLLAEARIPGPPACPSWTKGPGLLLGGIDRVGFNKALVVASDSAAIRARPWSHALSCLFESLPGRPAGFLLVGGDLSRRDRIFWPAYGQKKNAEAGLAGLASLTTDFFPERVLALADPLLAVRLQCRHFHTHRQLLPIVAWHDTPSARTKAAWVCLDRRRPVFWGLKLTAAMLNQAVVADGLIALAPAHAKDDFDHFVRRLSPVELFHLATDRAKPWAEFLATWAEKHDEGEVVSLLAAAERYGLDQRLLNAGPEIARLLGPKRGARTVQLDRTCAVSERSGMWYAHHNADPPVLVMNGTLIVDSVCATAYAARLRIDGKDIPAEVPVNCTFGKLRQILTSAAAAEGAVLYTASDRWVRNLLRISLLFHTPPG